MTKKILVNSLLIAGILALFSGCSLNKMNSLKSHSNDGKENSKKKEK
jgi:hypothetical protein